MLLLGATIQELIMTRDTVIFLLQNLGFIINQKKSVFIPVQKIEFLGVMIDSLEMTLSLPQEKVHKIVTQSKKF